MPENNIMDDLACNADVENEIRLLIGHGEAEISEIVRQEPKAYQMGSGFIEIPNQSLYPLTAKLSYSFNVSMNKTDDRQLQESTTISTKPGIQPIDNAATAYFTLHISIYSCTNFDQLHVKLCPALHYIFSYLWVENRIFNKFKLKNLICVNIVKCKVKCCLLPEVLHRFLTNLGSTGGPHEISRRAACGPRAVGWTALL